MIGIVLAVVKGGVLHNPTPLPLPLKVALAVLVVIALVSLSLKASREEARRNHGRKHKKSGSAKPS